MFRAVQGCLEWRGEGLERLLAALLTTPHAALVFVYANGLEVTPEGKASSVGVCVGGRAHS